MDTEDGDVNRTNLSPSLSTDWLYALLQEEEMEGFYERISTELQITRLSHFDFVTPADLEKCGISAPRAKALLSAARKKKNQIRTQKLLAKLVQPVKPLLAATAAAASSSSSSFNRTLFRPSTPQPSTSNGSSGSTQVVIIRPEELVMKEKLGGGSFGYVQKAEWVKPSGITTLVAVKVLKQEAISSSSQPDVLDDFNKEVISMTELNHPNLIKLYGIVLGTPLKMVTELAPLGSLRDLLRKEREHTPISELVSYATQITAGMSYMESKRYLHRDLAARNVLLGIRNKKRIIKIADFGLVRVLESQQDCYVMNEHKKVPFPWCAPESLKNRQFSTASDVWMFGVTVWEMFTFGGEPWAGMNGAQILQKIDREEARLDQPEACPGLLYTALLKCWSADPVERPTFESLHAFFSSFKIEECTAIQPFDKDTPLPLTNSTTSPVPPEPSSPKRKLMHVEVNDKIQVIEGKAENYFWKGQNQRTFRIADFPHRIVSLNKKRSDSSDISLPLKNSMIHTGHQGMDGKNWGNPGYIDDMYLKYPADPPDLMQAPAKELPPIPKLLAGKGGRTSPKHRRDGKPQQHQFSYNRFQNDNQEKSLASLFFGRRTSSDKKNPQAKVKRSASYTQLDRKAKEGTLIDFSDEIPVHSFEAANEMNRFHSNLTRTSSSTDVSNLKRSAVPSHWQSFDTSADEDRLYVNVPAPAAPQVQTVSHQTSAPTSKPQPLTFSAIAGLYDKPEESEYSSRDNYSMFNDEDWAACGMSTATGAGGPSTRYGSMFSGEEGPGCQSYESQAQMQINWHQQNLEFMRNRNMLSFNPNSLIHTHPAFNPPPYSPLYAASQQQKLQQQQQFAQSLQNSQPVIPPQVQLQPQQQPVTQQQHEPLTFCTQQQADQFTSLFGCPTFGPSLTAAPNGVIKQRPGFIYKDKGPAPAPPVCNNTASSLSQSHKQESHDYCNLPFPISENLPELQSNDKKPILNTCDVGDFMKELESKLNLFNKSKEESKSQGVSTSGPSTSTSGIPALKPPPSRSTMRPNKQMQVVPPLQSSSTIPSAPMRETLYGLPSVQNRNSDGMDTMIDGLLQKVASASREDCRKSLFRHNMDVVAALKDLQTSQLLRLGIAEKSQIETALRETNWDLESAASRLLDMKK